MSCNLSINESQVNTTDPYFQHKIIDKDKDKTKCTETQTESKTKQLYIETEKTKQTKETHRPLKTETGVINTNTGKYKNNFIGRFANTVIRDKERQHQKENINI